VQTGRWAFAALLGGNLALSLDRDARPHRRHRPDRGRPSGGLTLALPLLLILACGARPAAACHRARALVDRARRRRIFFALDLAAWHIGILQTKVANATLFGNSASLLLVIWGIMLSRILPRGWQALAILLAFAGSALLMGQSYEASSAYLVGDLLSVLAGALYTGYVLMMQRVRGEAGSLGRARHIAPAVCVPILLGTALALGETLMPRDWTPLILLALHEPGRRTGAAHLGAAPLFAARHRADLARSSPPGRGGRRLADRVRRDAVGARNIRRR
jgi:drug/metabolite transporter (DMT)-like permease